MKAHARGLFPRLESGATVITASRRLARVLTGEFHACQREQGRSVWNTPDILPLDAFLARAWEHVLRCAAAGSRRDLAGRAAGAGGVGASRFANRPPANRCCEFRKPRGRPWKPGNWCRRIGCRWMADSKPPTIGRHSRPGRATFRKRCTANNWMEARAAAGCGARIWRGVANCRSRVTLFLAGFDELTPQQSGSVPRRWANGTELEAPNYHISNPSAGNLRDSTEEIRARRHGPGACWQAKAPPRRSASSFRI